MAPSPMRPFPSPARGLFRRLWRLFRIPLLLLILLLAGTVAWLLRDPEPYFHERHGELISAETLAQELQATGSRAHLLEIVRLRSSSGLEVEMLIKRPIVAGTAVEIPRPTVVLLGGFRTGKDSARLVEDTHGVVVAAIDYPLTLEKGLKGWDLVGIIPDIRRGAMDTPPALMLALDSLLTQSFVDPERTELAGVSLGAPVVCVAGGLDPRFRRVWSIHGGAGLWTLLDHNFRRRLPNPALRAPVTALGWLLAANQEPARWVGRIAPRPFVMINGEEDETIPREAVETLYAAAREPKELQWMPGGHVQPSRQELITEIVERLLLRVGEGAASPGATARHGGAGRYGWTGQAAADAPRRPSPSKQQMIGVRQQSRL